MAQVKIRFRFNLDHIDSRRQLVNDSARYLNEENILSKRRDRASYGRSWAVGRKGLWGFKFSLDNVLTLINTDNNHRTLKALAEWIMDEYDGRIT